MWVEGRVKAGEERVDGRDGGREGSEALKQGRGVWREGRADKGV